MKQNIFNILRNIAPEAIINVYRRFSGKGGFYGNYNTWEEAKNLCGGYDSDVILNIVRDAALKVINGEAAYELDSILYDKIQYSWPVLAGLLWVASRSGNRLNLVDFGGSLGTSYNQNVKFLNHLNELHWSIVEQEKFVKCGREHFETKHLRFYSSMDECMRERHPDTILFSGSVQYLEKPYGMLEEVKQKGYRQIIFDRTPFMEYRDDFITIQEVPAYIYPASYPAWFFNLDKFRNFFSTEYELIEEFDILESFDLGEIRGSQGKGFIFRKKEI